MEVFNEVRYLDYCQSVVFIANGVCVVFFT